MKRAIHIIAALTLLASGLGALMWGRGHDITGSLLWLLAGILCFAPVIPAIELSIGARIKQPVKYGIILALIISGWVLAAYAAGDNGPNGLSDEMTELMDPVIHLPARHRYHPPAFRSSAGAQVPALRSATTSA